MRERSRGTTGNFLRTKRQAKLSHSNEKHMNSDERSKLLLLAAIFKIITIKLCKAIKSNLIVA